MGSPRCQESRPDYTVVFLEEYPCVPRAETRVHFVANLQDVEKVCNLRYAWKAQSRVSIDVLTRSFLVISYVAPYRLGKSHTELD